MTTGATFAYLRVLVGRELREIVRSPSALILTLIAPVLAAFIASAALGSPTKVDATIVVAGARGDLGDVRTLSQLAGPSGSRDRAMVRWQIVKDDNQARRMVIDGDASAALVIPPANAAKSTAVGVIVNRNAGLVTDLATSAGRALAMRKGAAGLVARAVPVSVGVTVVSPPGRTLNGAELYGPVVAVFFLFLTAGFIARSLQAERERGTVARLRVLPIGPGTIVAGKLVTMLIAGTLEFTTVLAVMSVVSGARWGNLVALGAVVVALMLAVGAVALMIASIARSPKAAQNLVILVALAFAALGGNLVPLRNLPGVARTVANFTPNGVAIRAFRDISANGRDLADVARPISVILAFAFVVSLPAYFKARSAVET